MLSLTPLANIADLTVGFVGTMAEHYEETGVPFLRSLNIKPFAIDDSDIKFISGEFNQKIKKSILHTDDVVIVRTGVPGTCCVIPEKYDGCNCSDLVIVHPNKEKVDPYYLAAYINFWGRKQISNNKVGAVQQHFNVHSAEEMLIALPAIEEQKKIANIIRDINAKIENNNAICADLEGMAKLLYDYWFVQFDFPDENGKPYKSSGGKMAWNEELKREIPEGWEVIRLGDHITADRGISYNSATLEGSGIPMINLASFNVDSTYKPSGLKTYSGEYKPEQVLRPYDLVMCNTQQTAIDPAKDIIGKTLLVPDVFDGDIVSSHHVTTIRASTNAFKYYLNAESKTAWFHKYVAGFASGTNILGLDFNGVLNYKTVVPPDNLMSRFANMVHSSEARKNEIIRENTDLASLRDFLLPMLMNGQVKMGKNA